LGPGYSHYIQESAEILKVDLAQLGKAIVDAATN